MAIATALLILALATPAAVYAAEHTVGGSTGWTQFGDYSNWASGKKFTIGDTLVFNYDSSSHMVAEVSQSDYDSCRSSNAIRIHTSGATTITLSKTGPMYFICSTFGHCSGGMKLSIIVESLTTARITSPSTPADTTTPSAPTNSSTTPASTITTSAPTDFSSTPADTTTPSAPTNSSTTPANTTAPSAPTNSSSTPADTITPFAPTDSSTTPASTTTPTSTTLTGSSTTPASISPPTGSTSTVSKPTSYNGAAGVWSSMNVLVLGSLLVLGIVVGFMG